MSNTSEQASEVLQRLDQQLVKHPHLAEAIHRALLIALHKRDIVGIDAIQDQAMKLSGNGNESLAYDPNQAERDRWSDDDRKHVAQITREYVGKHFTVNELDRLVMLTEKRREIQSLETAANQATITFGQLAEKVKSFCKLPMGEARLPPEEVVGTRVGLIRHLISDQLEFIGLAKNYLTIRDFEDITDRIVGNEATMGRIGGKAGGMILGHRILAASPDLEQEDDLPVAIPESYYLRSDVVEEFLDLNHLQEYQSQKYKPVEQLTREYPLIKGVFRNGDFPIRIVHRLREILETMGNHPLIVRSSSLLEDRIGTGFYGKYDSIFLPNQGTLEQRLRALLGGIAEVYASVLAADPIVYRREHNLIDYVEEMGILIQKVVGFRMGDYFLPAFAGVAFSQNEYRWSPRIRKEDGLMRIVMGLGTRAVDRAGSEYPRMVALGEPTLRPEAKAKEVMRSAQHTLDAINLKKNRLVQVKLTDLLAGGQPFPVLDRLVSIFRDDELYAPTGTLIDPSENRLCITFDKLLATTPLAEQVKRMLHRLEEAYGTPVDMEFASDGQKFYVLQCRTQSQSKDRGPVSVPENVPDDRVLFDAVKYMRTGLIEGIEYIVYVDPGGYDAIPTRQQRVGVARVVGRINHKLGPKSYVLIGPGRWGSNDIRLGVPVRYADINHCALLVEVAHQKDGFLPEVSFGTHFFQDLVEADIHYLPVYPDSESSRFNRAFFCQSANKLKDLSPADEEYAGIVHVIHVPSVMEGRRLTVAMDGDSEKALAYLA
ncbi:MAG: PEP/pyruvate-binding domain-containing protein [Planctomycetota bacterium]|jgi:hypothetical protein